MGFVIALAAVLAGCGGSTTSTSTVNAGVVSVQVTSPTSGSVIAGSTVEVRGTVTPVNATVQIQGQPAVVGNGVFKGTATLHGGKTTIDVIGSAPGATPGSTSVAIVQQSQQPGGPSKSSGGSKPSAGGANVAHELPGGTSSNATSCGGGLAVGPDTTCVFAEAVESSYRSSGGSSTVEAYSPVTEKNYEMTCVTSAGEVTCTGGIGAVVYFPE
jgi:hypothetical protein